MSQTFSHSGDSGDIIYSLPTIKACGGGTLYLYHHPGRTLHGMNANLAARLRTLLIEQDYIDDVIYTDSPPPSNLNGFRDHHNRGNLADMHLSTHGLSWEHRATKWLNVKDASSPYPVIMAKTTRYPNYNFDWFRILDRYEGKIGFVGFPDEHSWFCREIKRHVPFVEAPDFLSLARVIEGCRLFIGNPTAATAVAEGLKKNMIVEVGPSVQYATDFRRLGCILAVDGKVELPDIESI